MDISKLIQLISAEHLVIYGNGYIAKRLYNCIKKMGYANHIENVAVTDSINGEIGVHGKKVVSICDINKNSLILVAVHNTVADEMKRILKKLGFVNYVWIYPFLFDLEFGNPIRKDELVPMKVLTQCLPAFYNPAIYYLSLMEFCHNGQHDGDLYVKMLSTYTTHDVAKKRWDNFCFRLKECLERGYLQDYNIKINESYILLDGLHRLVLAKWFHVTELIADVYSGHGSFHSQFGVGGDILLHEEDLSKYYTSDEIERIKAADLELRKTD